MIQGKRNRLVGEPLLNLVREVQDGPGQRQAHQQPVVKHLRPVSLMPVVTTPVRIGRVLADAVLVAVVVPTVVLVMGHVGRVGRIVRPIGVLSTVPGVVLVGGVIVGGHRRRSGSAPRSSYRRGRSIQGTRSSADVLP